MGIYPLKVSNYEYSQQKIEMGLFQGDSEQTSDFYNH